MNLAGKALHEQVDWLRAEDEAAEQDIQRLVQVLVWHRLNAERAREARPSAGRVA